MEEKGFAPQTKERNICPGPVGQDGAIVVSVLSEARLMAFHWFHAMGATLGC